MRRAILLCIIFLFCSVSGMLLDEYNGEYQRDVNHYESVRNSSSWVISPSSGSHFGGDNITLTGSDFSSFFPEPDLWENFTIDSSADVGTFSSIVADSMVNSHCLP